MQVLTTRQWSDWVGTAAFAALAVLVFRRAPEFGLLILPSLVQEILIAISFLVRGRAKGGATGWAPRVVAYANSFVVMGFIWYASGRHQNWLRPTGQTELAYLGTALWLFGAVLAIWPLWHLRRSFSIEPEARSLVTSGPYRFARHPVYAVYILINLGILLRHLTVPFAAVMAIWLGLLFARVRFEEQVLAAAFPAYGDYRRRVAAFGPRFWPLVKDREAHP